MKINFNKFILNFIGLLTFITGILGYRLSGKLPFWEYLFCIIFGWTLMFFSTIENEKNKMKTNKIKIKKDIDMK